MRERPRSKPSHKGSYYIGGMETVTSECHPIGQAKGFKGYCKYCYRTHKSWWNMRPEDYDGNDIVLCGHCEHTMLRDAAEV